MVIQLMATVERIVMFIYLQRYKLGVGRLLEKIQYYVIANLKGTFPPAASSHLKHLTAET